MRNKGIRCTVYCILFFVVISCNEKKQSDEQIAKTYCGSCHVFPDPSLLDKKSWEKGVLPRMGFRLGLNDTHLSSFLIPDEYEASSIIHPAKPIVTDKEWAAIKNYFITHAPDSLVVKQPTYKSLDLFDISTLKLSSRFPPHVTLIENDAVTNSIYVGTRTFQLYKLSERFVVKDSFRLKSPPSYLKSVDKNTLDISLMGIMDPNDQPAGELSRLSLNNKTTETFIDSLKRPAYFDRIDFNNDHIDDYVTCNFGNYTGSICIYEGRKNGGFKRKTIVQQPGARRIIASDFDHNGFMDFIALFAQGDEQVTLFSNKGNMAFESKTLLRFPPVYGSSYLDTADFNHDGKMDLLYTNGDNADYSPILKPYHGVRIFLNKGDNKFAESWFGPMPGASEAMARDFDKDGDLDIAAISFFPDLKRTPEAGFIFFENKNNTFIPHCIPQGKSGRWLVMNVSDFDKDGDFDIILGALAFPTNENKELVKEWYSKKTALLILKNKTVE